ncbi:hypothetical protein P7D22_09145 [Lichenihabitans sp. Uapishka_5]|uniref:hypothetical protein n=1 Tax=Lichenihabitans sp. Uapishka_5 TaxID=3037302 RepID=UPI0029E81F58|nr:hypothetical protein [Lichenihabitans sp. Uapishka_5]MDX7951339.1 hypothetical protein [Lichenihabitans sp. Uapishka_5]
MADWHRGGWFGSIQVWARRLVADQLRENDTLRGLRRRPLNRILRRFLSIGTFGRFMAAYACVDLAMLVTEAMVSVIAPDALPRWTFPAEAATSGPPPPDVKAILLNVGSYLIGAQVGALSVISLALALVTLIAQRDDASTDVRIYYHESLAFELVASCVALIAILCVQLIWPSQFLLHVMGFGTASQVFKLFLLCVHLAWLSANLGGLAHFTVTTFGFVQQSRREALRRRYTANVVHPRTMMPRLMEQIYGSAGPVISDHLGLASGGRLTFGADFGDPAAIEVRSSFDVPVTLRDVRLTWVAFVVRRWHQRCVADVRGAARDGDVFAARPAIWFTPMPEVPLRGDTPWCMRRGGVPLLPLERVILRLAFRFRKVSRER